MTAAHGEERRKYVRISSGHIVRFETFTAEKLGSADISSLVQTVMKNVSAGGVLFSTGTKYDVGTLLKLEIDLPGWEKFKTEFYKNDTVSRSQPVIVLATIVRVEVVDPGKLFDIGACFVGIDEGHQWALMRYVDAAIGKKGSSVRK